MTGAPDSYLDLKVAIGDFLAVPTTSEYANYADFAIDLAEQRFNATLRTRNQVTTTTFTPDADGEGTLPADYVGFKRATADEGYTVPLVECSAEQMANLYPSNAGGIARHIAIDGDTIRIRPISSSSVSLVYYAAIPALTSSNVTNWLLLKMPGLYLASCLYEASVFLGDDEGMQRYGRTMDEQFAILQQSDRSERIGNRALRVRGATP